MEEHDFGWALFQLRKGLKVYREGWNGKGMWIDLYRPKANDHLPYIMMKTVDDKFVPWLASQTDILAEDWEIIE